MNQHLTVGLWSLVVMVGIGVLLICYSPATCLRTVRVDAKTALCEAVAYDLECLIRIVIYEMEFNSSTSGYDYNTEVEDRIRKFLPRCCKSSPKKGEDDCKQVHLLVNKKDNGRIDHCMPPDKRFSGAFRTSVTRDLGFVFGVLFLLFHTTVTCILST